MVNMEAGAEIPIFFSGKSIFITGGSGFIGKVLIERLLTTCPDISRLYLLMREKKGQLPETRIQTLKQCQVFDGLRAKNPKQLDKIDFVNGDLTRPLLGLAAAAQTQIKEVSVVFHTAASVKLQEELKNSVNHNLRPVLEIMKLCDSLPLLAAFIHISTAYSNAELSHIQEKVYPPPMELETLLKMVEDQDIDEEKTKKIIGLKPNTYTFNKAMAEHVVAQHDSHNYSVAIFRPTIVISSHEHPFPGWMEGLNGPSGVVAAVRAGVLRVLRAKNDARADMMPVDITVDTLIAAAWETAIDKLPHVRVYNCSSNENSTTWSELYRGIKLNNSCFIVVENRYVYKFLELTLQTIPLYSIEYIRRLLCVRKGRNLIKVNEMLQRMNQALEFFALREWTFDTDNVVKLRKRLSQGDKRLYNLDPNSIDWKQELINFIIGTWKYVMKE